MGFELGMNNIVKVVIVVVVIIFFLFLGAIVPTKGNAILATVDKWLADHGLDLSLTARVSHFEANAVPDSSGGYRVDVSWVPNSKALRDVKFYEISDDYTPDMTTKTTTKILPVTPLPSKALDNAFDLDIPKDNGVGTVCTGGILPCFCKLDGQQQYCTIPSPIRPLLNVFRPNPQYMGDHKLTLTMKDAAGEEIGLKWNTELKYYTMNNLVADTAYSTLYYKPDDLGRLPGQPQTISEHLPYTDDFKANVFKCKLSMVTYMVGRLAQKYPGRNDYSSPTSDSYKNLTAALDKESFTLSDAEVGSYTKNACTIYGIFRKALLGGYSDIFKVDVPGCLSEKASIEKIYDGLPPAIFAGIVEDHDKVFGTGKYSKADLASFRDWAAKIYASCTEPVVIALQKNGWVAADTFNGQPEALALIQPHYDTLLAKMG